VDILSSNDLFFIYIRQNAIRVVPNSHIPMYYQLERILEAYIREGALQKGDRLPAEEVVAEVLGVSRATATKAFQELLRRGWVNRRQGLGTIIERKAPPELDHLINLDKLIQQYRQRGITTRAVAKEIVPASQRVADALGVEPGDAVAFMRRVRSLESRPLLVVDCFLSEARFPGFLEVPRVEEGVYEALDTVYKCRVAESRRWLEGGELLSGELAEHLAVPAFSPVLVMRGLTSDRDQTPVVALTTYISEGVVLTCHVGRPESSASAGFEDSAA